jgi:hypothetical protein
MGTKPGAVMERPVSKGTCRHHWLIEPPSGPTSKGVCKLCGEVKVFDNILADLMLNKDNSVPYEPDDVVAVEDEIEEVA